MSEDKDYGVPIKHDPDFRGPLKRRSCTDVICLLLFLVFLACWGFVAYLAFRNGDPSRLLKPTDSRGRKCGLDQGVEDKPYLFFFDLTKCVHIDVLATGCPTPQVCVATCPSVTHLEECTDPAKCASYLICRPGIVVDSSTTPQRLQELYNNEDCARIYFESTPVAMRCLPLVRDVGDLPPYMSQTVVANITVGTVRKIGHMVVQDMSSSWPWIVGALCVAMLVCFLYIVLMRWFAGPLVWVSLAGVVVLLSYCIYASYAKFASLRDSPLGQEEMDRLGTVDSLLATKATWMVFLVASASVLAVVLLILLFLRKRIVVAIALIEEGSKAVASISSSLVFPLAPWVLQCVVLVFFVVVVLYLASSSDRVFKVTGLNSTLCTCNVTNGDVCDYNSFAPDCRAAGGAGGCSAGASPDCQFYGYRTPNYVSYLHAVNVFGLFWGLAFVSGLGQMVLAGTFASWYWTFHKSDVPYFTVTGSLLRTLRYHTGTVAFGSLILAICQAIRVVLEYLDRKLKTYDNAFARAVMCCLRCFFWCLEKFIKFINRNAYIMCAVHGRNFCRSAKDAFNLLMRNIVRVFVLDKVTDFLLFLGKLMITAGMVALSFFVFDGTINVPNLDVPRLNYYLLPVIIVGVATYCIACLFFNVYSMAIDTLFLCFLEDCERNDGSPEKPYFMPKSLRKILHKHNKTHHE
ncbi:choline transporter-like 2 isoform X2 [Bacillus rossius redtenbacheri]|uniref:choline transporter-like 2 isoform X2 n=1 Tax=Bacillus rossius redtenbacheri TaxID=93214 RepID=UPI002FDDDE2E